MTDDLVREVKLARRAYLNVKYTGNDIGRLHSAECRYADAIAALHAAAPERMPKFRVPLRAKVDMENGDYND